MLDMVGEAVDRLITIEAKNHGMPHGILQPMYDAARKARGNKPVTMAAARDWKKHLGKGDVVFIMTGAGYEPTMPKGESDGPPGAASLAQDPLSRPGRDSGVRQRGMPRRSDHRLERGRRPDGQAVRPGARSPSRRGDRATRRRQQSKIKAWISELYADYKPKAVVSTERLGAGADGNVHTRHRTAAHRAEVGSSRAASTSATS